MELLIGIAFVIGFIVWLCGIFNKPHIKLEEEYTEYAESMENMRNADRELNDAEYRKRLLDEDNKN